ncbi:hypothetical protein AAFF_G00322810 [Aldrovandia affinis]|uniref:Protein chibby homolog 3 n=1 Tax=Aldrovandia affinis TaxID=143900 RepID=A0AAD7SME4_9TELE|nr:hypothetical protein AAFF_G00322810 [Aldrovandia affinis]
MSVLKDAWDRLGHRSPYGPGGLRSLPPLRGASCPSGYILDYGSRMAALGRDGPPALSLAGHSFTFLEGHWVPSNPGESSESRPEARRLRREKQALQEENNALKLRLEALMDMLTEATARLEGLRQGREGAGKRPPAKRSRWSLKF